MKKVISFVCVLTMLGTLFAPAVAMEPEDERIDLGNGFYLVETVEEMSIFRAANLVGGSKSATLYYDSTEIGKVTLYARFNISGASAVAVNVAITGSGENGWTYSRGTTGTSGNTASGTAYFSNGRISTSCTLSISCDPAGNLS